MKFTCTKENLNKTLDLVVGVAGKQVNLPILNNILITVTEGKVEFVATNLEMAVRAHLRAKIEQPGTFTVPAKTLSDYVRLVSGDQVEIELEGNELHVVCGHSNTKIKGAPAEDYPVIPDIEEKHGYSILAEPFRDSLSKVIVAVAKNEIRPELSGIYCSFFGERYSGLILASTDSYRLAEKRVSVGQGSDAAQCIIPARTVYEMIRLLASAEANDGETQVRLWVSENQIAIRYGSFEMSSRLIDGKYPDYAQIIPAQFKTTAVFPVDVMVNTIKAASLFATTGINAVVVHLNAAEKTIDVSSTSTQTGEHTSRIDADVTGEENSILLNHRYILDGLQHLEENDAELCVNSGDAPCLLRPKGKDNYLYIVMPVRQ